MSTPGKSRRQFLKAIGLGSGAMVLWHKNALIEGAFARRENRSTHSRDEARSADYTLHIRTSPIESRPSASSPRPHTTGGGRLRETFVA
jgi:hypothetical protein